MITIPKTQPPPVLYKYYPPERLDVLEDLEVHFSSPSKFNDAFDTYHMLPGTADLKNKIGRRKLRNEMGVLCLTERPDNHMMWVNYARNHTGFVIGFASDSPFFESGGRQLRRVLYQKSPPILDEANENGCFYKAPEWMYEEEWRCIRRFTQDERRTVSIEWSMVKQIIFGHQIAQSLISRIVYIATAWSNIEEIPMPLFFSSTPSYDSWSFENRKEHFEMCDKCNGDGYVNTGAAKGD